MSSRIGSWTVVRTKASPARRGAAWLVLAVLATACVPSPGPFRLPAVAGRVVDRDTGAAVAGAEVIEWHRGAGRPGGAQPVYHARWTTADGAGRFRFPGQLVASPRMWLLKTYGPHYAFYHARYGLQHGAAASGGELALRGSLARAEQARADLQPYCRGELRDPGARRIAELACPSRPRRPQDPRAP